MHTCLDCWCIDTLAINEFLVFEMVPWVVPVQLIWYNCLIVVWEVDVPHVIWITNEIWVQIVIVPEVVRVTLVMIPSHSHLVEPPGQSHSNVSPEYWPPTVEISP